MTNSIPAEPAHLPPFPVDKRSIRSRSETCPFCGAQIDHGAPIQIGRFSYSDTNGFRVDGRLLGGGKQVGDIMGAIMRARGAILNANLLSRLSHSSTSRSRDLVKSQISRAKREMRTLGVEWPIRQARALGWYWAGFGEDERSEQSR